MKKVEWRDDLYCTHILVSDGPSLLQKKIHQQHLNHRLLAYFRVLSLPGKKSTTILIFEGKPSPRLYSKVLKKVFRGSLSNSYLQWTNLTNRPKNHTQFYMFEIFPAVWKWQNSSSRRDVYWQGALYSSSVCWANAQ